MYQNRVPVDRLQNNLKVQMYTVHTKFYQLAYRKIYRKNGQ